MKSLTVYLNERFRTHVKAQEGETFATYEGATLRHVFAQNLSF